MHRLTCRHSSWAPAESWQLRRHKRHRRKDWVVWYWSKGWRDSHDCSFFGSPSRAVYRWEPLCLCWTLPPHSQFWSCIGLVRSALPTQPTNCPQQPVAKISPPSCPFSGPYILCKKQNIGLINMHNLGQTCGGWPLLPARAVVSCMDHRALWAWYRWQLSSLWLLKEFTDSELTANLMLYWPDGAASPWDPVPPNPQITCGKLIPK